ncbi:MAG: hypothetical protein KAT00_13685 [Planctomycetes bacterium]|nr:hypothetical protein [Planctomycetota bacterium]
MTVDTIKIGDKVRSYDSQYLERQGDDFSFIEGEVIKIARTTEGGQDLGCDRYFINVTRDVHGGNESDTRVGEIVTPPVNGTSSSFGPAYNAVKRLDK